MANHILVVDDDHDVRNYLTLVLESKGYQVSAVETGQEALVKIKSARIDLVVLDVLLPDGTGLDFCRQIKELNPALQVPVVMLSSIGDETIVQHAVRRGADEYMTKPPVPELFLKRIASLLEGFCSRVVESPRTAFA
jgi:DNA-binding response OmpR family regulator